MLKKFQNTLSCMIVASEISHVFCCVLPTIFSIISLLAGVGIITAMPAGLDHIHEMIHGYEVPIIIVSGIVVILSWALYAYSKHIDCHDHGCHHEPCEKKKDRTKQILLIGTVLFAVNVVIYIGVHRNETLANYITAEHAEHEHETHEESH